MEKISYSVSIQVNAGPQILSAGVLNLEAYEKISVDVPAKVGAVDGTVDVAVSPGALVDTKLLLILAGTEDGSVTFKTSAAGAATVAIKGPITLIGETACSLLGTQPDTLTFTNSGAAIAKVTIMVGRKAVA